MASNEDVPLYAADKLLFAADLVDHMIAATRPTFANRTLNIVNRAERFRNLVYNGFNETMKRAIESLDSILDNSVTKDFLVMKSDAYVNRQSMTEYAKNIKDRNFPDAFQAKPFLKYCTRIANMTGYFLSYGVDAAPDFAVDLIVAAFPEGPMSAATWDEVNLAAQSIDLIGGDYLRDPTPTDSSLDSSDSSSSEMEARCGGASNKDSDGNSTDESCSKNFGDSSKSPGKMTE